MKRSLLVLAGLAALVLLLAPEPKADLGPLPVPGDADRVSVETVSEWMIGGEHHFHLIDVRPPERFLESGLRDAMSVPADSIDEDLAMRLPPDHLLIVYGERDLDATEAFGHIRRVRSDVMMLDGGYAAWKDRILEPDPPADDAGEDAWSLYDEQLAVARYLKGETDSAPLPERRTVNPLIRPRSQVKNEGC